MSALLDKKGAAAYLGCSERFMQRLVAEERVAVTKIGALVRFTTEALDAFIATSTKPAAAAGPATDARTARRRSLDRRHLQVAAGEQ